MASVNTSICDFRLRRTKEGIRVTFKSSPELEEAFNSACGDYKETFTSPDGERREYYGVSHEMRDGELARMVLCIGSSEKDGIDMPLKAPRTRAQLKKFAETVRKWLDDFYEQHMSVVDISITVQARLLDIRS